MSQKIQSDPDELRARLNQPYTTRVEALRQIRATIPLSPSAEKELQESDARSANGLKKTESSKPSVHGKTRAAASTSSRLTKPASAC